jgi:hypothetical protein
LGSSPNDTDVLNPFLCQHMQLLQYDLKKRLKSKQRSMFFLLASDIILQLSKFISGRVNQILPFNGY